MTPGVCALLLILAAVGIAAIGAVVVIEIGAHRARRDRVSPIIRRRVADRVQRKGTAL